MIVSVDHHNIKSEFAYGKATLRIIPNYNAVFIFISAIIVFFISFYLYFSSIMNFGYLYIYIVCHFSVFSFIEFRMNYNKTTAAVLEFSRDELFVRTGFVKTFRSANYDVGKIKYARAAVLGGDVLQDGLSSNNWVYIDYAGREIPFCRTLGRAETRGVLDFLKNVVGVSVQEPKQ